MECGDDHPEGSAGSEDIIDEKTGGRCRREWDRSGEVYILELGSAFRSGEGFYFAGSSFFADQGWTVGRLEMIGQSLAQEVECGGLVIPGGSFLVMEGTENDGTWRKGDPACHLQRAIDPGIQVRLSSLLESQQTTGKIVGSRQPGQIVAQEIMGVVDLFIYYVRSLQSHDRLRKYIIGVNVGDGSEMPVLTRCGDPNAICG